VLPLFRLDPDMDRWRDDMMRMWNRMTHEFSQAMSHNPVCYVSEGDDVVIVEVEIPGVDPAGVDVEADPDSLTVRGSWPPVPLGIDSRRRTGSFVSVVSLPADVDPEAAQAHFQHGLLTVELPKVTGPRRRLNIQVEPGARGTGGAPV
jgi:HSP20 family protein